MSHDTGRRAACIATILIRWFHFEILSEARGVTDGGVGSGALLGRTAEVEDPRVEKPWFFIAKAITGRFSFPGFRVLALGVSYHDA